jgi:hypothetical protein
VGMLNGGIMGWPQSFTGFCHQVSSWIMGSICTTPAAFFHSFLSGRSPMSHESVSNRPDCHLFSNGMPDFRIAG